MTVRNSDIELPVRLPEGEQKVSFLPDESKEMERTRRIIEQQGHRPYAPVNARDHSQRLQTAPEEGMQNALLEHPELENLQYLDGLPDDFVPSARNWQAYEEYKKAQEEKKLRNELQLNNAPKFSNSPKPRPAGM
ncbi:MULTISPECIES: hypothetical protein [Legionella]|uniref:Smr domain protein n=1 Tax=Legionella septentrionalis TaxID=2498109 RepID=A0A3S0XFE8_9GAMM|nr:MULTISPECIES: hypothetical protein [Legionella]MCP0914144.1 hypothetical protein [Legionella sp. 27cVA30]RUQ81795.1 hypothetical protein EKM59_09570 [Legionella septentrionalis]RUQ96554.1 hypothetical protein ELY11_07745 [Legionella septentrionalis]RUR11692.1 hypothetical protein ELY14_00120 [Legionella septentrionalis]RUR17379.1 hypothetical protein ELY10_00120 [Legionella septentrionalis]